MRLLSVELTRLRWRRAVIVLLLACFLVPALIWGGLAWNTRPVSDAELRNAHQQIARGADQPYVKRQIQKCVDHPDRFGVEPADAEEACDQIFAPQLEWYLHRPQLSVADERGGTGLGVLTILVGLVMLIGTTFVGHDWHSGSMSNQLLFEPRRLRVWAAKAGVVLLTGLVVSATVLAAYWGALWVLAESRDLQASGAEWELIRHSAMRGSLLVALAGFGGYAMTMFFRSTVATLGVLFAFTIGGSLVILAVLGDTAQKWLLPTNFMAVVMNGYDYYDGNTESCGVGGSSVECGMAHLTLSEGASYLGLLLAAAVVLSLWSFRRRDVP